jgi:GWxTD domain-containing protein
MMSRETVPGPRPRVRTAIAALTLLLVWAPRAFPQTAHAELPPYGDLIYAEAAQLPGDSAGRCRLDVFIRIAHDYIVFHRAGEVPGDSAFLGGVEMSLDVFDAQGQTVESANARKAVRVPNYLATESRDAFALLQQTFRLPPGRYRVAVHVSDGKSTRQRSIDLPVALKALTPGVLALGTVLPLEDSVLRADHAYRVYAFGASVPYARPSLLAVSCSAGPDAQWRYALTRNDPARAGRLVASAPIAPLTLLENVAPSARMRDTTAFVLGDAPAAGRLALFRIPFDTLEAGLYRLVLFATEGSATDSTVAEFRVFWKDMPLSLREPDFAVSVMRYILTEDEISDLNRGSDADQLDKLSAWWRAKDPTPGTIRNEMMEEYFRRVDQAYFAYRTLANQNGALTDRGKVHILFGMPEEVERLLKPGEPAQEIWNYPSLRKTFTFVDRERSGNFRLQRL